MWLYIDQRSQSTDALSAALQPSNAIAVFLHTHKMPVLSKEARIALAIQALYTSKEMSIQHTVSMYDVLEATLRHCIKGCTAKPKIRNG